MPLSAVGALLPYHSHVSPKIVVSALNHMIDDARNGKTIFYNIYSDAQKRDEPARAHTGLFFFRGRPGAPFAIIAPGGGFSYVGSVHEGFPHAVEISKQGYNAFVLKYRAGFDATVATQDLATADHSSADPPTFVVLGENDGISPAAMMERRVAALHQAGVELGVHGQVKGALPKPWPRTRRLASLTAGPEPDP